MLPYYITIAEPDCTRPRLDVVNGICADNDFENYILDKMIHLIIYNCNSLYDDHDKLYNEWFDQGYGYMDNEPFEAYYFRNDTWCKLEYSKSHFMELYQKKFHEMYDR